MGLFGTAKAVKIDKIAELQRKAEGALSVFRATYKTLVEVNEAVAHEQDIRVQQIGALKNELELLSLQVKDNNGYITKIGDILGIVEE